MKDAKTRRLHGFESMGSILRDTLQPYREQYSDKLDLLLGKWPVVAGAVLALHCRPFALKERKLFVKVDGAAWLHHVQFLKADLIASVNREIPSLTIDDIHFKVKDMSGGAVFKG